MVCGYRDLVDLLLMSSRYVVVDFVLVGNIYGFVIFPATLGVVYFVNSFEAL